MAKVVRRAVIKLALFSLFYVIKTVNSEIILFYFVLLSKYGVFRKEAIEKLKNTHQINWIRVIVTPGKNNFFKMVETIYSVGELIPIFANSFHSDKIRQD